VRARRRLSCLILFTAVLALTAQTALYAHHAIAIDYDTHRTLDVTGVIKEMDWNNPHAFVRLDVNGKTWLVTLLSPSALRKHGIDRSNLEVGKTFSAVGFPSRTMSELYAQSITVDGKSIELFPR
jgi:hypothetical protein